jgi:predicted NUDIX family phosphoesterase
VGQFLDAAYVVLRNSERPLSAREITDIAIRDGYLQTGGRTPYQTMKSKLSTDILNRGEESLFMRSQQATFALRDWRTQLGEYVADRYQKALFDEDVLVIPASVLSDYVPGIGLFPQSHAHRGLSSHFRPMRRREAEEDVSVIQLVSVFVLRLDKLFLTYKRTKRLPEARLHDYYSLAFGGHLNPDDSPGLFNIFDPQESYPWLERELREEVRLPPRAIASFDYRGLLYDTSRSVSCQHLGIVYQINLAGAKYSIGERGFLTDAKFESKDEIRTRIDDFENWSVLLLNELT